MQLQDVMFIVLGVIAGAIAGALLVQYIGGRGTAERVDAAVTKSRAADQATIAGLTAKVSELQSSAELHKQQALSEQRIQVDLADRLARETATVSDLRHELESRAVKLSAVAEELAAARSTLEQLRLSGEAQDRLKSELDARLVAETDTIRALREELEARAGRLTSMGEELAAARSTLEQLRLAVAAMEARVVEADTLTGRLRADLEQRAADDLRVRTQLATAQAEVAQRAAQNGALEAHLATVLREQSELRAARELLMETNAQLTTQVATLTEQRTLEAAAAAEKLQLLHEARERLANEFKLVASEIMEVNAKRFAEQSQTQIGTVLDPLRERLVELHKKVDEVYVADVKDRTALREQVQSLVSLNQTLSDDARNLTNALRGSNKAQGNWGELILQRILEDAGLREGVEFILQDAQASEDGRRQQPDVVIQLPEGRKIVVDAKVSMLAFERANSATTDDERGVALREHVLSVRNHVKGLSERRYERLYDTTLDFVVMFVPIEPAFMMAVTEDERLCADAWDRNILLVSPSTLLFVLRTVAYLWRQEAQSKNAKDIAERGAALYDKLASFVKDLEEVGTRIDNAQQSFTEARKKLSTGRGSVIRQAEMLKTLGVKSAKNLPKALVDEAMSAADNDDNSTEIVLLPTPQG